MTEQEQGITIQSEAVRLSGTVTMDVNREMTEIQKVETTKMEDLEKIAVLGAGPGLSRKAMQVMMSSEMNMLAGATGEDKQVYFGDPHIGRHIQQLKAAQFTGLAKNRGIGFTRKRSSKRKRK